MRFSDSTHFDIPKSVKYADCDSSSNSYESLLTKSHHTTTLFHIHYHQLYIITTLQIFSQVTAQILKYMTTYLSKSYLKPIKRTHLLTDHANYLKTNLFYLTLQ